jgi:hypothetical protein
MSLSSEETARSPESSKARHRDRANGCWAYEGVPAPTRLDWYPDVNTGNSSGSNQGGRSIVGNASYVAMGGEFTRIKGVGQQALARFAIRSLAPNDIGPEGSPAHSITAGAADALGQVPVSWRATWDRDPYGNTVTTTT